MSRQPCPCRQRGLAQSAFTTCEVWLSVSHITFLIFCSGLYLIFCSCWSQRQQEKQGPLSITHQTWSICSADVRGRSSSFSPSCPSASPCSVCSCHGPGLMEDAESCRGCSTKYQCVHRTWIKSTLCLSLWRSTEGREGSTSAPRATVLFMTGLGTCRSWADVRWLMGALRISPITSDELQTRCETTAICQDLEESFCWTGHSLPAHFQALSTWHWTLTYETLLVLGSWLRLTQCTNCSVQYRRQRDRQNIPVFSLKISQLRLSLTSISTSAPTQINSDQGKITEAASSDCPAMLLLHW